MKKTYIAPEAEAFRLAADKKLALLDHDEEIDNDRVIISDNDIDVDIP